MAYAGSDQAQQNAILNISFYAIFIDLFCARISSSIHRVSVSFMRFFSSFFIHRRSVRMAIKYISVELEQKRQHGKYWTMKYGLWTFQWVFHALLQLPPKKTEVSQKMTIWTFSVVAQLTYTLFGPVWELDKWEMWKHTESIEKQLKEFGKNWKISLLLIAQFSAHGSVDFSWIIAPSQSRVRTKIAQKNFSSLLIEFLGAWRSLQSTRINLKKS